MKIKRSFDVIHVTKPIYTCFSRSQSSSKCHLKLINAYAIIWKKNIIEMQIIIYITFSCIFSL